MKNYKNEQLQIRIEAVVNRLTVPDDFKPFITDLLLRRFYQYDFSAEEIQMDLDTLSSSLFDIRFAKTKETYLGFYSHGDRSITITQNALKGNDLEKLYSTFAHELYHALCFDIYNLDRLSALDESHVFNSMNGRPNYTLLEAFVEKGSYRTIYGTDSDNIYTNDNSFGYSDITFVVDMIASTFGVTEQALLRNGIQSRKKLATFLTSNTNYNIEDISLILDMIESNFVILHNCLYEKNNPEIDTSHAGINISHAIGNMTKICMEVMQQRLKSEQKDGLTQKRIDDYMFQYNKLINIVEKATNHFETMRASDKDMRDYSRDAIVDDYKNAGIEFQNTLLGLSERYKGVVTNEIGKFDFEQEAVYRNLELSYKTEPWDNKEIVKSFKKVVDKNITQYRIARIKNIFKRKQQKALPLSKCDPRLDYDILNMISISYGISMEELRKAHYIGKDNMVGLISYRTGIQPDIVYKQLCNISAFRHRAQRVNYLNRIKSENDKDHTLEFEYTMGCIYSKGFDALRERIKATNFDTITPAQMQGFKESYARLVDSVKGSIIRIDRTGEFKKLSPERILLGFQQIAALSKNAIIQTEFLKAINIKGLLSGIGDAKINDMIYWAGNGVLQNYGTGKTYNKPLSYYGIIVPTPFTEKQFRDNDYRLNSSQKGIRSWMLSTGDRLKVNIRINDFKDRIAGMKRPEKNKSSKTNRQLNDNHLDNNYNDQQDINEEGR